MSGSGWLEWVEPCEHGMTYVHWTDPERPDYYAKDNECAGGRRVRVEPTTPNYDKAPKDYLSTDPDDPELQDALMWTIKEIVDAALDGLLVVNPGDTDGK